MDTRDLEAFNAVYKYRGLSTAAKALYITPQGLSKTIQKLERELGTSLFTRKPSGMEPTVAGDRLYLCSRSIIEQLSGISGDYLSLPADYTVPCTSYSVRFISSDIFAHMHSLYPEVGLNLLEKPDAEIDEMLFNGKVEVAIMQAPVNAARYSYISLAKLPVCVLVNKHNPLAQKETLTLSDLKGRSLLYIGSDMFSPIQKRAESFREKGLNLIEVLDNEFCWMSAENDTNIAVTAMFSYPNYRYPNVREIPLKSDDSALCTWEIGIAYRANSKLSAYGSSLVDYICENLKITDKKYSGVS